MLAAVSLARSANEVAVPTPVKFGFAAAAYVYFDALAVAIVYEPLPVLGVMPARVTELPAVKVLATVIVSTPAAQLALVMVKVWVKFDALYAANARADRSFVRERKLLVPELLKLSALVPVDAMLMV